MRCRLPSPPDFATSNETADVAGPQPRPGVLKITPYAGSEVYGVERDLINVSSNESAFGASERAVAAAIEAATGLRRYPEIDNRSLREAIAARFGLDVSRIICGNGSDEIIKMLCTAYAGPGDEVVYSAHGFQMYPIAARAVGAEPVLVAERNLTFDVDAVLGRVNERTRLVFIANPNNPTGSYIGRDELARLHAGLPDRVLLVIDSAYAEYVTRADYDAGVALASAHDNVVMTRTFSKIFALAALRIGWAYCPPAVMDILERVRSPFNVNAMAIAAGVAALADTAHTARAVEHNAAILPWFTAEIERMGRPVNPSAANFVIVHFDPDSDRNATAAYRHLFANNIVARRVAGYGLPDWVRLSIGTRAEMERIVQVLGDFLTRNSPADR
jgi:histidinol-phosphate aminotransferase